MVADMFAIARQTGVTKAKQNHGRIVEEGIYNSGRTKNTRPAKPKLTPRTPKVEKRSILTIIPRRYVNAGDSPITSDVIPTGIFEETKVSIDIGIEKANTPTKK